MKLFFQKNDCMYAIPSIPNLPKPQFQPFSPLNNIKIRQKTKNFTYNIKILRDNFNFSALTHVKNTLFSISAFYSIHK